MKITSMCAHIQGECWEEVFLRSQVLLMRPVWGNSMFVSRYTLCTCVLQEAERALVCVDSSVWLWALLLEPLASK